MVVHDVTLDRSTVTLVLPLGAVGCRYHCCCRHCLAVSGSCVSLSLCDIDQQHKVDKSTRWNFVLVWYITVQARLLP